MMKVISASGGRCTLDHVDAPLNLTLLPQRRRAQPGGPLLELRVAVAAGNAPMQRACAKGHKAHELARGLQDRLAGIDADPCNPARLQELFGEQGSIHERPAADDIPDATDAECEAALQRLSNHRAIAKGASSKLTEELKSRTVNGKLQ